MARGQGERTVVGHGHASAVVAQGPYRQNMAQALQAPFAVADAQASGERE